MTKVIFSYDTEDYVNRDCAQGILECARIMRKNGIKGCFNVVGRLAEALEAWGRYDIIEELKNYHEIDYHSREHSMHPTINENTDRADFYGASEDFKLFEGEGMDSVRRVFGVDSFPAACPPGDSTSYVANYAYADMGIAINTGDIAVDARRNRLFYNCNLASLYYDYYLDLNLINIGDEDEAFLRNLLDTRVAKQEVFVFAHHPQRGFTRQFCDILNFNGENVPEDKWILSEPYPKETTDKFYKNLDLLARLLVEDERFEVVTYSELKEGLFPERRIDKKILSEIMAQLDESFFPVTVPDSYCIADVFHACRRLLLGDDEYICSKVYGFMGQPYAITEPVTLKAEHIIRSAKRMSGKGFIPEYVYVDDKKIGPADWIRAAAAVIAGAETVTVTPGEKQIDMEQFPRLKDWSPKGNWVHCASLEDNYLSERFRLQTWTFRLPKATDRFIFE